MLNYYRVINLVRLQTQILADIVIVQVPHNINLQHTDKIQNE